MRRSYSAPAQGRQIAPLKVSQVPHRVVQPVDVVDPQAVDVAAHEQVERQAMAFLEDLRILHADRGQLVDVEEAAVVDFVGRGLPVHQPIDLPIEEVVEAVVAARILRRAVEIAHVSGDVGGDPGGAAHEAAKPVLDDLLFPLPFRHPRRVRRPCTWAGAPRR